MTDPLVLSFQQDLCRIQSIETGLGIETVKLVMDRVSKECEEYTDWESLKSFFSRRGRPIGWDQDLIDVKRELRN